ncbi:hypothetical protein CcaverHIS002_0307490 [Cutaneotrichosporon cavernicola]|uniref:Ubiquitin-like protein ATG12 n=1 Tax=Cutaneotrichosporon cavernicola TaxID=279322 RepID=A0AA48IA60_9TREE|nr:uncharacterized protein CcaverHIS019_0307400 [Cutaneotrichosporon cavernicola]BEJ13913.1 hypothetical protein CspHIS471_0310870 [Cutaneotrichosporon sp. HIS471]BEI82881.1 hypothetical protein CcaverHIS002_0307490 [Cutaneotrichosporon cavernicola]BEI90670.1 hypothetical protein CcaverHIS019_0307400 [Cutaneotrichosporon cavernicola]BEI98448.1 hypothetical protein CcaverHIS631_0307470 [Cutaneotrichosporon cavernicola]BEJ06221.1 hypothetical protein CcaverHIS641_0307430 [Cutaneotrichosporon cav
MSAVEAPPPTIPAATLAALDKYKAGHKDTKVVVLFKSIGSAPIMKNNVFKISANNKFHTVNSFLRKQLGFKAGDPLFTYINGAFAPTPDDIVGNLYDCFQTGERLIVNYSNTQAWG